MPKYVLEYAHVGSDRSGATVIIGPRASQMIYYRDDGELSFLDPLDCSLPFSNTHGVPFFVSTPKGASPTLLSFTNMSAAAAGGELHYCDGDNLIQLTDGEIDLLARWGDKFYRYTVGVAKLAKRIGIYELLDRLDGEMWWDEAAYSIIEDEHELTLAKLANRVIALTL